MTAAAPETLPSLPIAIRPMRASDLPWVTDTWLNSFREANYGVPHDEFFDTQRKVIKHLFGRSRIAIACDPDDSDQVFGYVVWEPRAAGKPLLHWAYTKHAFRRFGIFRRLLMLVDPDQRGVLLTHRSIHADALRKGGLPIKQAQFSLIGALVDERSNS